MEITIPGLKEVIGAGDLVKAATDAMGIKPCTPCEERRRRMNQAIRLVPRRFSFTRWTAPPETPEGWRLHKEQGTPAGITRFFVNDATREAAIIDVIDGQYKNYRGFCCDLRSAEKRWDELCR